MSIPSVTNFDALPTASENSGAIYFVSETLGEKFKGYYRCDGLAWYPSTEQTDVLRSHIHLLQSKNQSDEHLLDRANHTGEQAQSTVTGLVTALEGKAAASHGHSIGGISGLADALDGKSGVSHGHAISDTTGLQTALDGKHPLITAGTHVADASTNATTNASAASVTIVGISVPTNASYVALVDAYNDLATKHNANMVLFNTLLARLEAQGLLQAS